MPRTFFDRRPRRAKRSRAIALLAPLSVACAPPAPNAVELREHLGACDVLAGTRAFATDVDSDGAPLGVGHVDICERGDALWWDADLDIDCDGGRDAACIADASYRPETAATDAAGEPLDASVVPYVVMPLPWDPTGPRGADFFYCDHELVLGGVVLALYDDQLVYGVIGDEGPVTDEPSGADGECAGVPFAGGVIGEASYAMAEALGIDPDPNAGGVDCEAEVCPVTYVALPGAALADAGDADEARHEGQRRLEELLRASP